MGGGWIVVVIVAAVVLMVLAGWFLRQRRSRRLRDRFGPEYERTVHMRGGSGPAEAELQKRVERVARLDLRPLSANERRVYLERWMKVQRRFVDDPRGAVLSADELVKDVMRMEGYPVVNFEQRAADISVDHPLLVSNYRVAHAITLGMRVGEASSEQLRKAIVHYRFLFEQLLEASPGDREVA
jgi:hypothetical protein